MATSVMHTAGGGGITNLWINNTITSTATTTNTFTVDGTNNWMIENNQLQLRPRQISRRERIIMQALPSPALLQGPSCKIGLSEPIKHMIDEMVDRLTLDGVDRMNHLTKAINYLDLNEVNFEGLLRFKDNSLLRIGPDGNYEIIDQFARVIYKGNRIREFNKFIEASSLLEDFINDCGKIGVRQSEFMSMPIEVFIHWLIYKAALKDEDPLPEGVFAPENHPETKKLKLPRCLACGKFISPTFVEAGINFCNEVCLLIVQRNKAPMLRLSRQVS